MQPVQTPALNTWSITTALVGRIDDLRLLFDASIIELDMTLNGSVERDEQQRPSDQFHFNEAIAKAHYRNEILADIDTDSTLFQTMIHSYHDVNYTGVARVLINLSRNQQEQLGVPEWRDKRLAHNIVTDRIPPFVHFAGPKSEMDLWWSRMWWYQSEDDSNYAGDFLENLSSDRLSDYGAALPDGTSLSWHQMCGNMPF